MKRTGFVLGMMILSCGLLAGCKDSGEAGGSGRTESMEQTAEADGQMAETETQSKSAQGEKNTTDAAGAVLPPAGNQIADQTFEVELNSLGKVTFASYAPETAQEPNADVVFALLSKDEVLQVLEGMEADHVRTDRRFVSVAAVSFPDYNGDGINDIITICNYEPMDGDAEKATEIRIYRGEENGSFVLERELSHEADSALAEKTIKSVLGFLGAPGARGEDAGNSSGEDGWQQAYIDYVKAQDERTLEGYAFIYLDDDAIPELVQIGDCEATGCKIVSWYDGKVYDNQLSRLYFSYIEGENLLCNSEGNMDCYYDLVYSLKKGELELVAEGYYGAEDNSNVQFDAAGEPIYYYEWNGIRMSKEEYRKALNAVYNQSRAQDGYEWDKWFSVEETLELLEGM